ncbi:MAG: ATP-binding protein [Dehalococcoidia bacterium]
MYSRLDQRPIITIGVPTRDRQRRCPGCPLQRHHRTTEPDAGSLRIDHADAVLVVDRAGQIILGAAAEDGIVTADATALVRRARSEGDGVATDTDGLQGGRERVVAFAAARTGDWLVFVDRSQEEAFGPARRTLAGFLGILTFVIVGGMAATVWAGRRMDRDAAARRRAEQERAGLLALEHRARQAAEAAQQQSGFLAEAGETLASSLDYETTLAQVARLSVPRLADWCSVDIVTPDGAIDRLAVAAADARKEQMVRDLRRLYPFDPAAAGGVPGVVRSGAPELTAEVRDEDLVTGSQDAEHLRILRELGMRSILRVPLTARGRTLGAISLISSESGRRYGADDLPLALALAHRAALAMDNARLYAAESRARAEAEAASHAKDEFLSIVSHELRTPLTSILGWSRMLRTRRMDPETAADAMATIERSARAQARLIEDLLDVSRIITGDLRIEPEPTDLADVAEDAAAVIRPAAAAKAVRLEVTVDPATPTVLGDPDRLGQVVGNLLSNAVKFTPQGGWVRLSLAPTAAGARIVVQDSGRGIDAAFLPHVFDRFRQGDTSSTRRHGGLGLGLAIVQHVVTLHGGTVRAASEGEGRGATFTVELPCAPATPRNGRRDPAAASAPAGSTVSSAAAPLAARRILVVEDDRDSGAMLAAMLRGAGGDVAVVTTAAAALAAVTAAPPDVILSDIGLPGEDGYGLLRALRARASDKGGGIPAIALTAFATAHDRAHALAAGFAAYLPKPVEPDDLIDAVTRTAGGNPLPSSAGQAASWLGTSGAKPRDQRSDRRQAVKVRNDPRRAPRRRTSRRASLVSRLWLALRPWPLPHGGCCRRMVRAGWWQRRPRSCHQPHPRSPQASTVGEGNERRDWARAPLSPRCS